MLSVSTSRFELPRAIQLLFAPGSFHFLRRPAAIKDDDAERPKLEIHLVQEQEFLLAKMIGAAVEDRPQRCGGVVERLVQDLVERRCCSGVFQ